MAEAFPGKLAEIYSPRMVLLKVERRMVKKKLILTKHLLCARQNASFLYAPKNLFHAKKL